MSETPRFRAALDEFVAYRPGRVPTSPTGKVYKLASNETPYPPLPSVVDAITAAAGAVNRYPDNSAAELVTAIGERFGVPVEHVAVGCGSVGATQQLLEAVGEPGAGVIYAWRSFEAYPLLVTLAGASGVQVPLRNEVHDLPAIADRITDATRLVLVCNPNNPTGTAVRSAELAAFLDRVPESCLVVIDEAYREFVRDPDVPDGLGLYRDRPNVAVLRTFSKAYGLAGLRVGFLVGHQPVADAVRKTQLPFTVTQVAQAAALASLAAEDELLARVEAIVKERERVQDALGGQGWTVPASEANFVWLRLGDRTGEFAAACERAGITVRPFAGEGARVTVADREANDAFLDVTADFQ